MILQKASLEALRYACINYHYTKKQLDNISFGYSVFTDNMEWCGVIAYGRGASPQIAKPYKLVQGEVIELLRVALNGKQGCTSKAIAISLKLVKKDAPLVKLIVSYADGNQDHIGTIYQASNWYYEGEFANELGIKLKGKIVHRRTVSSKYKSAAISYLKKHVDKNAVSVQESININIFTRLIKA